MARRYSTKGRLESWRDGRCVICGRFLKKHQLRYCSSCKAEKQREWDRKWKSENPDKVKAQKKRYYKKHADEVKAYSKEWYRKRKEKGIMDESGNPLDDRETIYVFGEKKDNPNFRKPLVGHSYERKIYGIAKQEGDDEPKVFRLNLRGTTAKEFRMEKPFVPVRFLALVYGDPSNGWYELYPSKLTKFSEDKKEKKEGKENV